MTGEGTVCCHILKICLTFIRFQTQKKTSKHSFHFSLIFLPHASIKHRNIQSIPTLTILQTNSGMWVNRGTHTHTHTHTWAHLASWTEQAFQACSKISPMSHCFCNRDAASPTRCDTARRKASTRAAKEVRWS